ncbi:MAG: hypothetical protein AAGN66_21005 [Acidobacteriota bacterium]
MTKSIRIPFQALVLTALLTLTPLAPAVASEADGPPQDTAPQTDAAAASVPTRDFGRPHPDAAPELAQFAFLIGHWRCDVDYLTGDWKTRVQSEAEWTAYYIQDGRAIMDDFRGGFGEGYLATTIRVFDRQRKGWRGYWIDGQRGRWSDPLIGTQTDFGMRLETGMRAPDPSGKPIDIHLRYEFHDIEADRFHWRQNASTDGGTTWQTGTATLDCKRQAGP